MQVEMIKGKNKLFNEIRNYSFEKDNSDYSNKVNLLENAINNSVNNILKENSQVHLAYSGGVDSSLILIKILRQSKFGHSIIAHTIGSKDEPDILYSKKFIKELKGTYRNLYHNIHIMKISKEEIDKSNEILGVNQDFPDNYYMLMKAISSYTKKIVCCDCIDELLGGYHAHRNPKKYFLNYESKKSLEENKNEALKHFMSKLIPEHLSILDKFSSHFNIDVYLPYGDKEVINCCKKFSVDELVDGTDRKKPIYEIAKRNEVSQEILERRKYGLVSAFNVLGKP